MNVSAGRSALIIANSTYQDEALSELRAPAADAHALAAVLGDPAVGDFDVRTLLDATSYVLQEAIEDFFADRGRDELLVLHFSCHGIKDASGDLYFAAANTRRNRLAGTAVSADFVNRLMHRSRSRRVVLLLDCCYSGAFERGLVPRATTSMAVTDHLAGGQGRVVITASSAMEYAFEGDARAAALGELAPSVFTSALVRGLQTGEADRDQDGLVTLGELYKYLFDSVRAVTPHQTPGWTGLGVQDEFVIARRGSPVTDPAPLPEPLEAAIHNPLPSVRLAAVSELVRMYAGRHAGLALAADLALRELTNDDSRSVAHAAHTALRELTPDTETTQPPAASQASPTAAPRETPVPGSRASRQAVPPAARPEGKSRSMTAVETSATATPPSSSAASGARPPSRADRPDFRPQPQWTRSVATDPAENQDLPGPVFLAEDQKTARTLRGAFREGLRQKLGRLRKKRTPASDSAADLGLDLQDYARAPTPPAGVLTLNLAAYALLLVAGLWALHRLDARLPAFADIVVAPTVGVANLVALALGPARRWTPVPPWRPGLTIGIGAGELVTYGTAVQVPALKAPALIGLVGAVLLLVASGIASRLWRVAEPSSRRRPVWFYLIAWALAVGAAVWAGFISIAAFPDENDFQLLLGVLATVGISHWALWTSIYQTRRRALGVGAALGHGVVGILFSSYYLLQDATNPDGYHLLPSSGTGVQFLLASGLLITAAALLMTRDDHATAERNQAHQRGIKIFLAGTVATTILLIATVTGWAWTRDQYYLGVYDNKVAIFQGVPYLSGLASVRKTYQPIAEIAEPARSAVWSDLRAKNLADAELKVNSLPMVPVS
jgi:hypothetical protein